MRQMTDARTKRKKRGRRILYWKKNSTSFVPGGAKILCPSGLPLRVQWTFLITGALNVKSLGEGLTGTGHEAVMTTPLCVHVHFVMARAPVDDIPQNTSTSFAPLGHWTGGPSGVWFRVNWMKHGVPTGFCAKTTLMSFALGLQKVGLIGPPFMVKKKQPDCFACVWAATGAIERRDAASTAMASMPAVFGLLTPSLRG